MIFFHYVHFQNNMSRRTTSTPKVSVPQALLPLSYNLRLWHQFSNLSFRNVCLCKLHAWQKNMHEKKRVDKASLPAKW